MNCVVCMFKKEFPIESPAVVTINGTSLCYQHALKVIDRGDQLQGYTGWMLECENNDWWSNK